MTPLQRVESWFASQGWRPFSFQRQAWRAYLGGESGLVHAPTGTGKTYSAWYGAVLEALGARRGRDRDTAPSGLVVWITPLRALAGDTVKSLRAPLDALGLPWTVELRTGDTSSSAKQRQRKSPPTALVTTPESASVLLSYPESASLFSGVRLVVVDEWHELLSSKRGVQTELVLSRLRRMSPGVRTWGLSATLSNLEQAARVLVGVDAPRPPKLVRGIAPKSIEVRTLIPDEIERYPWAGHLGTKLVAEVAKQLHAANTTLLFTNTRSQAEIWFRELMRADPSLLGQIALHHGSLEREIREQVESMLRADEHGRARLRCVVCTSSLDLGVDFSPVDQVIQVGSPKGVARLVQRAGRSGHSPGAASRIIGVPTHAMELLEFAAARDAVGALDLEDRAPLTKPLDVLVQHLVTVALGTGFREADLRAEVRSTHAFAELTDAEWAWAMEFVKQGGPALAAYPDYARIAPDGEVWRVPSRRIALHHRLSIGTITADAALNVRYVSGKALGHIEENFITRLRPGSRFVFAGRVLELVQIHEMTALVRPATGRGMVPRWNGGRMALSTRLAHALRHKLGAALGGEYAGPEMKALRPLLELQRRVSRIPASNELLVELHKSRDAHHAFVFTFAGRLAHEGMGALISHRLAARAPMSVHASASDHGIEFRSDVPLPGSAEAWRALLTTDGLVDDLLAAINASQLARRQFREIARVAGLTRQDFPGQRRQSARHLQASSEMFYDVLSQFDPSNLLLSQASREVLEHQLEFRRIREALAEASAADIVVVTPGVLTPLSFPLWAESLRSTLVSSERWEDRVRKMVVQLEKKNAADEARKFTAARRARAQAAARAGRRGGGG